VDLVNPAQATVRATVSSRINSWPSSTSSRADADLKVRKAVAHAVNVDELIQNVLRGRASKMAGCSRPSTPTTLPSPVPQARSQAGQPSSRSRVDPKTLTLTLDTPSGRYPLDKDISQAVAAQLAGSHHGQRRVNEWGTHLDKIKNRRRATCLPRLGPALDAQALSSSSSRLHDVLVLCGNKPLEDKIQTPSPSSTR